MRVSSIRLHNFKRFSDLVISGIPKTAKLVVVVGPNGCGKSSLFDAFLQWYRSKAGFGNSRDDSYFRKSSEHNFDFLNNVIIDLHGDSAVRKGSLYVRTAYRNDPDFNISNFQREEAPSEQLRFNRVIDNDLTVGANYQRLLYDTMAGIYDQSNNTKTVQFLREELIGQVRDSMRRVFGDLILNNIVDPLGQGTFFFEKGDSKNYHYKNLSGGEKAAFDLLLDIHVKKKYFPDTIYCIDEIETHLHTRIQGALLKELYSILPETAQLWVTTHSLGVVRAALELSKEEPGTVSVIDFDGVEPDMPREIAPSTLGRISWEKMLSITLDDLSPRVSPTCIVVCEGSTLGTRRKDFDAEIYNRIFRENHPDMVFVSGGSASQVNATAENISATLRSVLPATTIYRLIDRDDRSDIEVQNLKRDGFLVIERRNIESYLLSDEAITKLLESLNALDKKDEALAIKTNSMAASVARGNPNDDVKSASGEIYVGLKRLLGLTRCGNSTDEFMRDTMAYHINSNSADYIELHRAIISPIA
jgi:predicted ATPase